MKGAFIFDRCLYSVNVHADTVFIRGLSFELKLLYIRDSKEKEKRMEVKGREKRSGKREGWVALSQPLCLLGKRQRREADTDGTERECTLTCKSNFNALKNRQAAFQSGRAILQPSNTARG